MMSLLRPAPALRRRRLIAAVAIGVSLAALTLGTLTLGDLGIDPLQALCALVGVGERGAVLVVQEWRLPRAVLGILIGALLALSGALFQIVTRNPLGSPDVLGFSTGAFTGVLIAMTAGAVGVLPLTAAALLGGCGAAIAVFMLSIRTGTRGLVIVITGIGVTAILGAVNTVLVLRADDLVARAAAIWATGSLNGVDAGWIAPSAVALVLVGAVVAWRAPALQLLELGDERADVVGARPALTRGIAIGAGVVAIAVATAVTGPIAFVALAAPQIARRVWRSGTIPLAPTAALGAVLLCASDLLASRLFAPAVLPTGLVTLCLGGLYLAWLLAPRRKDSP